jgi:hypothetical protein
VPYFGYVGYKKEKLKQRISQKTYNTSFYPEDPVAKGETCKKSPPAGLPRCARWPRKRGLVATFRENRA